MMAAAIAVWATIDMEINGTFMMRPQESEKLHACHHPST